MADFDGSGITVELNINTLASPTWKEVWGTGKELRWNGSAAVNLATSGANWPPTEPPGSVAGVPYAYVAEADTTLHGVLGGGSAQPPTTFDRTKYKWGRVSWDDSGTFAAGPIITAYPAEGSPPADPTPGDGSLLGGEATDTDETSYVKGILYGGGTTTQVPGAAPGADPAPDPDRPGR